MIEKVILGPTCVTFPTGQFVSPGFREFHTEHQRTTQKWFMGCLIESTDEVVDGLDGVNIPEPQPGERGSITVQDRTFTVVRDDDTTFWDGMTKEEWLLEIQIRNIRGIAHGELMGWWDVDNQGNPQQKATQVSIAEMQAQNKTLMAHLMVDLGFFASVGQAKKNGWDKPLEIGRHELGPKKKRAFVEIVP